MSQKSKLTRSRNNWKGIAGQRAGENRYLRKELSRVKKQRDHFKKELKDTRSHLSQLQASHQGLVVQYKADLVLLALQLFLVARIGFRAVSRVLGLLAPALGIKKAPCPQTIINWVTRLSIVRIQSAPTLKVPNRQPPTACNGFIWMIDTSIALGTGKILTVLALDAHHHQRKPNAPGFQDVYCIAVSVGDSWTGEIISCLLERLIAVLGRPAAYLKDGGTDLQKAIRLLGQRALPSPCIDDISHVVANLLKAWYCDHPVLETFLSACGRVAGKLKQTILACLIPPKVHTKARFMNLHRLARWARDLLNLSPPGRAPQGSILSKLRGSLDRLPGCRAFIKRFLNDAVPLLECQKIVKTQGLSHRTLEHCEPLIQSMPTAALRHYFLDYLHGQLDIAKTLGLENIGMPISSDQIESLYALGKQHGVGKIKDANRIATRLPALCGIPTRAEAQQVLAISLAEQNRVAGCLNSLTKQRRQILKNPNHLQSLATNHVQAHVELVPDAKNRSKNAEIVNVSACYPKSCGPSLKSQTMCNSP